MKIFWHEGSLPTKPIPDQTYITKTWEQEMTSRISSEIRARELTLTSAFKLFDSNKDEVISRKEFTNCLINILSLNLTLDEIDLFFQKLPQPLNYDNFERVFSSFIMRKPYEQNRMELRNINEELSKNTLNLMKLSPKSMDEQKNLISNVIRNRLETVNPNQVFNEIDNNKDGYVSIYELKLYLTKNGLTARDNDVLSFLDTLDTNRDGKIDIKEFFDYVFSGQKEILQGFGIRKKSFIGRSSIGAGGGQNPLLKSVFESIFNYMEEKNMSFYQLYQIMDENKDNYVSRDELSKFLRKRVEKKMTNSDITKVLDFFDDNKDRKISIKEFIDKVKEEALNVDNKNMYGETRRGSFPPSLAERIVDSLTKYLKSNNKKISNFFNEIDKNDDGYLSYEELDNFLNGILDINFKSEDMEKIFGYFDYNCDGKISIAEFHDKFKNAMEKYIGEDEDDLKNSARFSMSYENFSKLKPKIQVIYYIIFIIYNFFFF